MFLVSKTTGQWYWNNIFIGQKHSCLIDLQVSSSLVIPSFGVFREFLDWLYTCPLRLSATLRVEKGVELFLDYPPSTSGELFEYPPFEAEDRHPGARSDPISPPMHEPGMGPGISPPASGGFRNNRRRIISPRPQNTPGNFLIMTYEYIVAVKVTCQQ